MVISSRQLFCCDNQSAGVQFNTMAIDWHYEFPPEAPYKSIPQQHYPHQESLLLVSVPAVCCLNPIPNPAAAMQHSRKFCRYPFLPPIHRQQSRRRLSREVGYSRAGLDSWTWISINQFNTPVDPPAAFRRRSVRQVNSITSTAPGVHYLHTTSLPPQGSVI